MQKTSVIPAHIKEIILQAIKEEWGENQQESKFAEGYSKGDINLDENWEEYEPLVGLTCV